MAASHHAWTRKCDCGTRLSVDLTAGDAAWSVEAPAVLSTSPRGQRLATTCPTCGAISLTGLTWPPPDYPPPGWQQR